MGFLPGAMIGGKYRLERKIAEGGVGEVWIAVDEKSRRVAIKRLLPETAKDQELVARFRREAVLLGKINSEHVSHVIEQITDPKVGLLLVMEFVDGESLADLLDKRRKFSVAQVIDIGVDIARAIGVLHEANIIHRDIKPENVIMRRVSGGATKAVLIDFGFARLDPHGQGKRPNDDALTGITRADTMLGTVAYMAPEQVLNSRDVSRAADVYALGAILYRAMSGRHAFGDVDDVAYARAKLDGEAPPLVADRINVSAAVVAKIIMRALRRRPADRYDRIETMLNELAAVRDAAASDDPDAPTQNAPVSSLLGADAAKIAKFANDGATSSTDRVVVNLAHPQAVSDPPVAAASQAAAATPDESSVTRRRQQAVPAALTTIPIPTANPVALPPPAPMPAANAGPPPSMRLAPPPVPPKMGPMAAHSVSGVDDELPAHLHNTARNRAVAVAQPAKGADDDVPAHLHNTSRTRGMPAPQLPAPMPALTKKSASGGISFGAALASMAITLIAGFIAGWIVHAGLSGHSPLEMPASTHAKP